MLFWLPEWRLCRRSIIFCCAFRKEGYDVSGLPANVNDFRKQIMKRGSVMRGIRSGSSEEKIHE